MPASIARRRAASQSDCTQSRRRRCEFVALHVNNWQDGRMSKRPWYRLHWATWGATIPLGCLLFVMQLIPNSDNTGEGCKYGWPFVLRWESPSFLAPRMDLMGTVLNAPVCTAIILSCAFVVERHFRRPDRTLQFTLLQFAAGVVVLCALLALLRIEVNYFGATRSRHPYHDQYAHLRFFGWQHTLLTRHGLFIGMELVFGLTCTLYNAGWIAFRLIGRVWNLPSRPTRPIPPSGVGM